MASLSLESFTTDLFEQVRSIQTSHSVIPRYNIPFVSRWSLDEHYFTYQDQMVDFAFTINQINRIRTACKKALKLSFNDGDLKFPIAARFLATVLLGYGECGELAAHAALELISKTDYLFKMIVLNRGSDADSAYNHAFLVVSRDHEEISALTNTPSAPIELLCHLKNSFIIDSYLGVFCRSVDIFKGLFGKYLKAYHFDTIKIVSVIPENKQERDEVFEQALKIKKVVEQKELFPELDCELFQEITKIHFDQFMKKLSKNFPKTQGMWKMQKGETLKFFIEGKLDQLSDLTQFLAKKSLQFVLEPLESGKSHRLIVENPKISLLL